MSATEISTIAESHLKTLSTQYNELDMLVFLLKNNVTEWAGYCFSSKITPTVGVEPTTFGLEVQRASPLRHAGLTFTAVFTYLTSYDYIYLGKIYLATSNIG